MDGQKAVERQLEVPREVDTLVGRVDRLENIAKIMTERLLSIMRPEPDSIEEGVDRDQSANAPLSGQLAVQNKRIMTICDIFDTTLARLEL